MTSLNRLRWTHSGHQIAVGDDDGHVFIYDVGEVSTSVLYKQAENLVSVLTTYSRRAGNNYCFQSIVIRNCQFKKVKFNIMH